MEVNPIILSMVQKRLDHIAHQMGWVMIRTARSPIFSQSHDFSCFISDHRGIVISQADGLPIHTGGGGFATRALLRAFGNRISEGDVYLLSDPYVAGGNHLPDWTMLRPAFVDGHLCGFTCNRAHQSDIGGGAAGTYNAAATEIFHEGIRLPPMKLVEEGKTRDDLWELLLLNSRCPDLLDGDLRAMLGSTKIGADRISALVNELGIESWFGYADEILSYAERQMRAEITSLPDGKYIGQDMMDTDCFEEKDINIQVECRIHGDSITFDFRDSDAQIKGFKNSSIANTHSSVYMAAVSFLGANIAKNEGTARPFKIIAPEGTVVNARPPAPMTMCTTYPAANIIHACWKALAQADPERACAGWGKISHCITSGSGHGDRTFVLYHWHASVGAGAVLGRDGFNSVGQLSSLAGRTLPNVETYEQVYPIQIHKQEFRQDGGGAGQYRGGTGVHYRADVEVPAEYSYRGEANRKLAAFGIGGGLPGVTGATRIQTANCDFVDTPQYGVETLPPLSIAISSAGGGGWGDPLKREPDSVIRDIEDEMVSCEAAREVYGVVTAENGAGVDLAATQRLRERLRTARRGTTKPSSAMPDLMPS